MIKIDTMIKTIRYTAFKFWISFLFVNLIYGSAKSQTNYPSVFNDWKLYTVKNEVISDSAAKKCILVFRSYRSCADCLDAINQLSVQLKDSLQVPWFGVGFSDSLSIMRKRELALIKEVMPDLNEYFVYYHVSSFLPLEQGDAKTLISPCLLLVKADSVEFISYNDLFYPGVSSINQKTIKRLYTFFKLK